MKMITILQIHDRIEEAILASGMTQNELARRLYVHRSAIGQYLSGRSMPSLDTFANLCAILDVDANDILCIADYKPDESER